MYLTNLTYYNRAVLFKMKHLCLYNDSQKQLQYFLHYVLSVPYTVIHETLQIKGVKKHRNAYAD